MPLNITYFDKVKYSSQDFNDRFSDFFGSGILKSTDFPVTYPSTANMTLNIGIGTALINGYRINNDSVTTLTLNPSDSANSRIDIVQIGYTSTTDSSGLTTGDAVLEIKQGVAAATPVEPGADTNFIKLYAINVPANATSITSSNVTDKRSLVPLNIDGSQITFNGAQKTIAQDITAPLSPDDKDLWIDTSVDPNVLKRYDVTTTSWVKVTPTQASEVGSPPTTRKVSTGTGLTGGGDLSADRTISLDTTYLGTTSKAGLLQLVDSIASTDATKAATANSVKMALDWVTSFGLGGNAKTGMTDANTIAGTGFYEFVGSEANLPTLNGGVLIHVDRDTRPIQLAINYQYNTVYSRSYTGANGWTPWVTLLSDTPPSWTTMTLLNGWTRNDGGSPIPAYRKLPWNLIQIKGLIKGGTTGTICNLPAGYRPPITMAFPCGTTSGVSDNFYVQTDGSIVVTGTLPATVRFDGIIFPIDQ